MTTSFGANWILRHSHCSLTLPKTIYSICSQSNICCLLHKPQFLQIGGSRASPRILLPVYFNKSNGSVLRLKGRDHIQADNITCSQSQMFSWFGAGEKKWFGLWCFFGTEGAGQEPSRGTAAQKEPSPETLLPSTPLQSHSFSILSRIYLSPKDTIQYHFLTLLSIYEIIF